jgi:hypothetical protein
MLGQLTLEQVHGHYNYILRTALQYHQTEVVKKIKEIREARGEFNNGVLVNMKV